MKARIIHDKNGLYKAVFLIDGDKRKLIYTNDRKDLDRREIFTKIEGAGYEIEWMQDDSVFGNDKWGDYFTKVPMRYEKSYRIW
ncbi:hypothetical protein [Metabacillus indicus]|uniref:hypothetical protein n=1 Tax=Metabacillus indicus TaxID=246786 RepID=UPI00049352E1|nr:hypothetical protein [Metabacillus indicus]KEZ47742.1 hypothetical protein AZ46_0220325 [Metabacillus indicus LMG 22858]